jgi:hypothetical protein
MKRFDARHIELLASPIFVDQGEFELRRCPQLGRRHRRLPLGFDSGVINGAVDALAHAFDTRAATTALPWPRCSRCLS